LTKINFFRKKGQKGRKKRGLIFTLHIGREPSELTFMAIRIRSQQILLCKVKTRPHFTTDLWGGVPDHYRVSFTSSGGYATFRQTLFVPGLSATQYVTIHANGLYDIEPAVLSFH
jgi:hypothetical protein